MARPRRFKTPQDLLDKAEEYFEWLKEQKDEVPSLTGFATYMGTWHSIFRDLREHDKREHDKCNATDHDDHEHNATDHHDKHNATDNDHKHNTTSTTKQFHTLNTTPSKKTFTGAIENIKRRIAQEHTNMLLLQRTRSGEKVYSPGAMFYLKCQHGWQEQPEQQSNKEINISINLSIPDKPSKNNDGYVVVNQNHKQLEDKPKEIES